jgi:tetratricopeptide (TPR) repeat protein
MKQYGFLLLYFLVLAVLFGCGRDSSSDDAVSGSNGRVIRLKRTGTPRRKRTPGKSFVSAEGKYTNVIYGTDYSWLYTDRRSIDDILKELDSSPGNPDLWVMLGRKYMDSGQLSKALEALHTSAELAPDAMLPPLFIAECSVAQGKNAEAADYYRRAFALADSQKELQHWAAMISTHVIQSHASRSEADWAIALLEEVAGEIDDAPRIIARHYININKPLIALDWVEAGIYATTNKVEWYRLAHMLTRVKRRDPSNARIAELFNTIASRGNLSEYEQLILQRQTITWPTVTGEYPRLCYRLADLATNIQQRYIALFNLAGIYASQEKDAGKVKELVDMIIGPDPVPPQMANQLAHYYVRTGCTNDAVDLLETAITHCDSEMLRVQMLSDILRFNPGFDEERIDSFVADQPSNVVLLVQLADRYARKGWYDREVEFRERALSLIKNDYELSRQISLLAKRYIEMFDNERLAMLEQAYAEKFSQSPAMVSALVNIHFARGDTNAAFEFLCDRCTTVQQSASLYQLMEKLMRITWPEEYQRDQVIDLVWDRARELEVNLRNKQRSYILNMLVPHFVRLNRLDDAIAAVKLIAEEGSRINNFYDVIINVNDIEKITALVDELCALDVPKSRFMNSVAQACNNAGYYDLACNLYVKALAATTDPGSKANYLQNILRLATQLKKQELQEKTVGDIIAMAQKPGLQDWVVHSLAYALRNNKFTNQYEQFMLGTVNSKNAGLKMFALRGLVDFYTQCRNHAELERIMSLHFPVEDITLQSASMFINAYRTLGKQDEIPSIINSLSSSFTNKILISQHGSSFISKMQEIGMNDEARELLRQWINGNTIPVRAKLNLLYHLDSLGEPGEVTAVLESMLATLPRGNDHRRVSQQLMSRYVNEKDIESFSQIADSLLADPDAEDWLWNNIARHFQQLKLHDRALALYDSILDKARADNQPGRINDILQQKALCFKVMGRSTDAIACAQEMLSRDPKNYRACELLGTLYAQASQPEQALDAFRTAIIHSERRGYLPDILRHIQSLYREHDLSTDPGQFVQSVLSEVRTPETLLFAARLRARQLPMNDLEEYFTEALSKEKDARKHSRIYNQWIELSREYGTPEQTMDLLKQYAGVCRPDSKPSVMRSISSLLIDQKKFDEVVQHNRNILDTLAEVPENSYHIKCIKRDLTAAYLATGRNDEAWKLAGAFADLKSGYLHEYIRIGRQLGKTDEVIATIETFKSGNVNESLSVARTLMDLYKSEGRGTDITRVAGSFDSLLETATDYQKNTIADLYVTAGMSDKAIEVFKQLAVQNNNNQRNALNRLFSLWKKQDKLDEALSWAEAQEENADVLNMMAYIHKVKKNPEEAIACYQKAITLVDNSRQSWLKSNYQRQLVRLAVETKKPEIIDSIAIDILNNEKSMGDNPHSRVAQLYKQANNYEKAARHYMKAIESADSPQQANVLQQQYASCLLRNKQYEKAAQTYNKLLHQKDIDFDARLSIRQNLIGTYEKAGQPNKARETRRELVNIYKRFLRNNTYGRQADNIKYTLAMEYKNLGDTSNAKRILEELTSSDRDSGTANRARRILDQMNK